MHAYVLAWVCVCACVGVCVGTCVCEFSSFELFTKHVLVLFT